MKPILAALLLLTMAACQKERRLSVPSHMHYINFKDIKIGFREGKNFDLDGNGTVDIGFKVYVIGDPVLQMDKYRYCAASMIESNFPVNKNDDVDIRRNGDLIQTENTSDYEWFRVSLAVLAQKNIGLNGPPFWTGVWKDVQHQYLPIQIMKEGKRFNGWVELSFDQAAEKIILHRSGVSTVAEIAIKAGQ